MRGGGAIRSAHDLALLFAVQWPFATFDARLVCCF
jgi:hypothetical protein